MQDVRIPDGFCAMLSCAFALVFDVLVLLLSVAAEGVQEFD
jgi:hypothetical protein